MKLSNTMRRRIVLVAVMGLLGLAVWQFGWFQEEQPKGPPCVPGRQEIKDAQGKVIQVMNTICAG